MGGKRLSDISNTALCVNLKALVVSIPGNAKGEKIPDLNPLTSIHKIWRECQFPFEDCCPVSFGEHLLMMHYSIQRPEEIHDLCLLDTPSLCHGRSANFNGADCWSSSSIRGAAGDGGYQLIPEPSRHR